MVRPRSNSMECATCSMRHANVTDTIPRELVSSACLARVWSLSRAEKTLQRVARRWSASLYVAARCSVAWFGQAGIPKSRILRGTRRYSRVLGGYSRLRQAAYLTLAKKISPKDLADAKVPAAIFAINKRCNAARSTATKDNSGQLGCSARNLARRIAAPWLHRVIRCHVTLQDGAT
jgi:hypothetical protein